MRLGDRWPLLFGRNELGAVWGNQKGGERVALLATVIVAEDCQYVEPRNGAQKGHLALYAAWLAHTTGLRTIVQFNGHYPEITPDDARKSMPLGQDDAEQVLERFETVHLLERQPALSEDTILTIGAMAGQFIGTPQLA